MRSVDKTNFQVQQKKKKIVDNFVYVFGKVDIIKRW